MQELIDHGRRIAELERKVSELYKRIGQLQPLSAAGVGGGPSGSASATAGVDPRVAELAQSGNKIEAIKLHRELTGLGLAEAKDAVDQLG